MQKLNAVVKNISRGMVENPVAAVEKLVAAWSKN